MGRRRLILGSLVAAGAALAVLFGGALRGSDGGGPAAQAAPEAAAGALLAGFAAGDTASYVRALERIVERNGRDGRSLALLGLAYQQRARETGDPTFYPRAEAALRRALQFEDQKLLATTGLAAVAASRHRFRDALALAREARRLGPASTAPYGVLGDALLELGRYDAAFAAIDRMAALKPSLASYTRVAYARELLGRPADAIEAMRLALDAAPPVGEHAAWTLVQLGNLYFDTGRLAPAARAYRAALRRLPGYVHADAALARVEAARGRYAGAIRRLRDAVETLPLPQYAILLGETLEAAGREREAHEAYGLVAAIQRLLEANGVRTELETALFDLDHDRDLAGALRRAHEAYRAAPGVNAEDVLAWALYKNGRCQEALVHSRRALRLGTRDALKLFHRGMIERCLGRPGAARRDLERALEINPAFSLLYAPVAREALR